MHTNGPSGVPGRSIVLLQVVAKKCGEIHPLGASTVLYRPFPPSTLRQLHVTFPHADRRGTEIDEQRAVRAKAARAASGGRAELATPPPVTRRERSALALAEDRLARCEPGECRDETIEKVEPADGGEPLLQRHRSPCDGRGNRVAHVPTHPHRQPVQGVAVPTALAEDAGELALPQQP